MGRAWREHRRIDQLLTGPQAGQRVQAIGQRLGEHQHIGLDAEVLHRPQGAGAPEAHLDFVDHHQHAMVVEHLLQAFEEIGRWHHIAARALDRLDVEGRILALLGLGVPDGVVLVLELARKLLHDGIRILFRSHALGAAERIREGDELRAVTEMAEAAAVAVAGGDARGTQGTAVVAAFKREHQAFAMGGIAHHLERVFNRLGAAHVEMHAAWHAPFLLGILRNELGQLDLRRVQVLAGHLGQLAQLLDHLVFQALVLVAEVHGRIPHLQIQVRRAFLVIHVAALAAAEDLGGIDVVNGVAKRAVLGFISQQLFGIESHGGGLQF